MGASRTLISPSGNGLVVVLNSRQGKCESDSPALVRPAYSARELRASVAATAASTRKVAKSPTISAAPSFAPGSLPSRSPHYHRGTPDATSGRPGRGERSAHTEALPGPASGSASPRNHAREAQALPLGQVGARLESPAPDPSGTDLAPAPLVVCARCRLPIRKNPALPISFCELHGLTEFVFIPRRRRP
jgi:hypothetical protein